jgi:GNAT superfamily N-acetyltransferase
MPVTRSAVADRRPPHYGPLMKIRDARVVDAPAACHVLRRSIIELCAADHRNDPAILAKWLANKTPEIVASWITQPGNSVLLVVESGDILGVGSVTDAGRITLNYVSPDARFRGVSRALLNALETRAAERGNTRCTLSSTETARRFYRAAGYVEAGPPASEFGTRSGYPMTKDLAFPGKDAISPAETGRDGVLQPAPPSIVRIVPDV